MAEASGAGEPADAAAAVSLEHADRDGECHSLSGELLLWGPVWAWKSGGFHSAATIVA